MSAGRRRAIAWAVLGIGLVVYPNFVPVFWAVQIGAQALLLGIIALSLTFLAGYGGMFSLAQMTLAGITGYTVAYFSPNLVAVGIPLSWPYAVLAGIGAGTLAGVLFGLIAVRTKGIYLLMITLAIAMGFFYFVRSNAEIFNAWDGIRGIKAPTVEGVSLLEPKVFYYLCLVLAALAYLFVIYVVRTPFGLALQGIRDNPRRMSALGYWVALHRVLAFGAGGLIAAVGGVLYVWYHGRISAGSVGLSATIDILVISVIGGLIRPFGAFVGAVVFLLIDNFAIDLIERERFNTVIGLAFLLIVVFSPNGLIGIAQAMWARLTRRRAVSGAAADRPSGG